MSAPIHQQLSKWETCQSRDVLLNNPDAASGQIFHSCSPRMCSAAIGQRLTHPPSHTHMHTAVAGDLPWGVFCKKAVLYHAKTCGSYSWKHKLTLTAEQVCVLPSTVHCNDSLPPGHRIIFLYVGLRQLPVLFMSTSELLNPCRNSPYCATLSHRIGQSAKAHFDSFLSLIVKELSPLNGLSLLQHALVITVGHFQGKCFMYWFMVSVSAISVSHRDTSQT